MTLRTITTTLAALLGLLAMQAQDLPADTTSLTDPDEVFTLTDEDIAAERLEACRKVAGTYRYKEPYVQAEAHGVIGCVKEPIAKSKLRKKLTKAYKKIRIKKNVLALTLNPDGTYRLDGPAGLSRNGKFSYNTGTQAVTLSLIDGILPVKVNLQHDGKKLHLGANFDRLLTILNLLAQFLGQHGTTAKALGLLANDFDEVTVGFTFSR